MIEYKLNLFILNKISFLGCCLIICLYNLELIELFVLVIIMILFVIFVVISLGFGFIELWFNRFFILIFLNLESLVLLFIILVIFGIDSICIVNGFNCVSIFLWCE